MEKRESSLDLLRIFAALGVTLIHYHDECAALHSLSSLNMTALLFLKSLGICSVNVFLLISGYFLINSDKRKLGKIAALILQVSFFNLLFLAGRIILDGEVLSLKNVIAQLIPVNYFIILYAALYVISPYINKVLHALDTSRRRLFVVIVVILFSIYPTLLDFTQEVRGEEWWGLSTIGAWGNQQGFNIVNFVLLYCLGACLKLDTLPERITQKKSLLIGISLTFIVVFIWAFSEEPMTRFGLRSAWCYHNPLVILLAVQLFALFRQFKFNNSLISQLGGAAFTSYLMNSFVLKHSAIDVYATQSVWVMLIHYLLVAVSIYVIAVPLHKVYWFIIKPIEKR